MKTTVIEDLLSKDETFFLYNHLIGSAAWHLSSSVVDNLNQTFRTAPQYLIQANDGAVIDPNMYYYFQSIIFRVRENLRLKNIGCPKQSKRIWVNGTYSGTEHHSLHIDDKANNGEKSVLIFLTPVWHLDWKGSFFIDGEEYKYSPGQALVYDSNEYHTGESPHHQTQSWLRLTANIILSE